MAQYTAGHLNRIIRSKMIIGIAWGTTLDTISQFLTPQRCYDIDIVQLNGSGNGSAGISDQTKSREATTVSN